MSLFQDEKTKAESVLLADEVKAKSWIAAHKAVLIAFAAGVLAAELVRWI